MIKLLLLLTTFVGAASLSAQQATARDIAKAHSLATLTVPFEREVRINTLRLRPIKVIEDSRCPRMVSCVWRGRLKIELAVRGAAPIVLADDAPVTLAGGTLRLIDATPKSQRGEAFDPKAYRFTIQYAR